MPSKQGRGYRRRSLECTRTRAVKARSSNGAATVMAEAQARGVADRVVVLPPREDVPEILCASDVVVDASWAGLGITGSIREAMAWVQRHGALLGRVESRRLMGELEHRLARVERRIARDAESSAKRESAKGQRVDGK